MSAFAARKSLWGTPASSSSIKAGVQEDEDMSNIKGAGSARPSAGTQRKKHTTEAESEADAALAVPVCDPNERRSPAQTSSVSAVHTAGNDLPPRAVLQHSSFRPNRKNYQEKAHGRTILKLAEGEVSLMLPPKNAPGTISNRRSAS